MPKKINTPKAQPQSGWNKEQAEQKFHQTKKSPLGGIPLAEHPSFNPDPRPIELSKDDPTGSHTGKYAPYGADNNNPLAKGVNTMGGPGFIVGAPLTPISKK